jgi:hypothetical protein
MNDFTLHKCSFCDVEWARVNFTWCCDCEKPACAHADVNCGIDCPCCDWFVCGACVEEHSNKCWEASDHVKYVSIDETDLGTVYSFFKPEVTKLAKNIVVFSNDQGVAQVRIKKNDKN